MHGYVCLVEEEFMINPKLGILGLVVFAYVVFVPIIPFHYFYNVDLNSHSAVEQIGEGFLYFDAFSRPASLPLESANLGVWGVQSISATFMNFGVVSDGVCAFNPAYAVVHGYGLLVLTVPITVVVILGLALLFLHGRRLHPPMQKSGP
jgi:hypothetical protein